MLQVSSRRVIASLAVTGLVLGTVLALDAFLVPSGDASPGLPGKARLVAAARAGAAVLAWTSPATDGGTPVEAFRIYRSAAGGAPEPVGEVAGVHTWVDADVAPGVAYAYQVRAVNARGEGPASNEAPLRATAITASQAATSGRVVLTFDDGYRSHLEAAGILERYGVRGTFYVSSGHLRVEPYYLDYLSAAEVRALADAGHDVQSHTVSHPDLTTLGASELSRELRDAKAHLEQLTGRPVDHLAYPYGAYNDAVQSAARQVYATGRAVTTDVNEALLPEDPYAVPGVMVLRDTSVEAAKGYVDFALSRNATVVLVFHRITDSPQFYDWRPSLLEDLLAYAVTRPVALETFSEARGAPSATVPGAPALAAETTGVGVTLRWTVPASGGSPITEYRVNRGAASWREDATFTVPANQTSFIDHGVADGATAYYHVHAVNALGEGPPSNEVVVTRGSGSATGRGTIAFTFDDGYRSHAWAGDVLAARGFRGTFYVPSGYLREGPYYTDYLSAEEVRALADAGHDVESHTVTHRDLTTLSPAEVDRELRDSRAALETLTGRPVRHFAYPYGAYNDAVVAATASVYATGRAVTTDLAEATGASGPYDLPGLLILASTSLETVKAYVDHVATHNLTLALVFHDFSDSPDTYDWTPAELEGLVAHVAERGVAVRTIADLHAA